MKSKLSGKKIKITIKDVAKEAGVSLATTSYVLNGKKTFSDETKKKVFDAVDKLEYKPSSFATAMRTGKTKSIGLIIPNLENPFFPELIKSIEKSARNIGYTVILIDSQNDTAIEKEGAHRLIQLSVEGIIWCPLSDVNSFEKQRRKIPIVVIDRPDSDGIFDCIYSDYLLAAKLISNHIKELKHPKIGIISGPESILTASLRTEACIEEIEKISTVVWCVQSPFTTKLSDSAIEALARNEISLLVAGNDMIAIGAILYLRELGLRVPEDVSVIGYDGTSVSEIFTPKLTTIKQSLDVIGEQSIQIFSRRTQQPTMPLQRCSTLVELVSGGSTVQYDDGNLDEK